MVNEFNVSESQIFAVFVLNFKRILKLYASIVPYFVISSMTSRNSLVNGVIV